MSLHLQREMEDLKKQLLSLCALVEEQVEMAVRALVDHDAELAAAVDRRDAEIDHREVEVEEECLKALALYQPVAIDLRFVVAALKMNNDLERIGDLAVNIARKAKTLARHGSVEIPFDLCGMWEKSRLMLRDSIDALVNRDASLAHSVCARDDEVDRMKHDIRRQAEQLMVAEPARLRALLTLLAASRSLERIADHATNIAEDVIYMLEGRIIRHGAIE
ncbi:MAG: phosphate signaling complex protein PhoU [Pirellulales bacterium]|jgi:phosphate transport system protein|nr:phosphate signaling complex protein PhoU [Thermoguttaceae bacterium]MDD4788344.1 phosphate signaling complex protein PhoU [Pirellulales bacterium]MDI9446748.1 phosphate signaling complex protein PhoU [Planctomycetota bacterium]NLZ01615.1 phosphate signaling complex protein PhoU [Pirellulaceae bacterium]